MTVFCPRVDDELSEFWILVVEFWIQQVSKTTAAGWPITQLLSVDPDDLYEPTETDGHEMIAAPERVRTAFLSCFA